jgi:hypothetical protein
MEEKLEIHGDDGDDGEMEAERFWNLTFRRFGELSWRKVGERDGDRRQTPYIPIENP